MGVDGNYRDIRIQPEENPPASNPPRILRTVQPNLRTAIPFLMLAFSAAGCALVSSVQSNPTPYVPPDWTEDTRGVFSTEERPGLDVVLVIDVSESMTHDNRPDINKHALEDPANPAYCNSLDICEPFKHVKDAAANFASSLLDASPEEEEDRLAVVTFATGWQPGDLGTIVKLNWTNDREEALDPVDGIPGLKVYDPGVVCPFGKWGCPGGKFCPEGPDSIPAGPCLYYSDPDPSGRYRYNGLNCARVMDLSDPPWIGQPKAISACTTTNIGGGLQLAGELFAADPRPGTARVVILLTDGAANATFGIQSDIGKTGLGVVLPPLDPEEFLPQLPLGFCPEGTWDLRGMQGTRPQYCQDGEVDTHHSPTDPAYDADDYARDQGKYAACAPENPSPSCEGVRGQGAFVFAVGLGEEIMTLDSNPFFFDRKPYGASFLRFLAALGDDGDATSDPCAAESEYDRNCGNYYYAASGADLEGIFVLIASRIGALLAVHGGK
jgi:hypothetical protein